MLLGECVASQAKNDGSKNDFIAITREYDYKDYKFDNSVKIDLQKTYESIYDVCIPDLKNQKGNLIDIIKELREEKN